MNNKLIAPALFCTLLSSTALAGELVIDISPALPTPAVAPGGTPTPATDPFSVTSTADIYITPTAVSTNAPLLDLKFNDQVVSVVPDATSDLNGALNLGDVDNASPVIENNTISVIAAVNAKADADGNYDGNNENFYIFDPQDANTAAEALIGSINVNSGIATSSIDNATWGVTANDVTTSDIGINNNKLTSLAIINGQSNSISGDASSRTATESSTTVNAVIGGTTTRGLGASGIGDFVIAAYQRNEFVDNSTAGTTDGGTASSRIIAVDMNFDINSIDDTSSIETQNNIFFAGTEVNFMDNRITVAHVGMDRNFVIAALQESDGNALAEVSSINMEMDVESSAEGGMTISGNQFRATASMNDMFNQILSDSGSGDANIFVNGAQYNTNAVTSLVTDLFLDMTVADVSTVNAVAPATPDVASGDMSINGKTVLARSYANRAENEIFTDGSGDGPINVNMIQENIGAVTSTVSQVVQDNTTADARAMTAEAAFTGTMSISNNDVASIAYANMLDNVISNGSSGSGDVNLDLSQITTVSGTVTALTEDSNFGLEANTGAMTGSMEIKNNDFGSYAYANIMTNTVSSNNNGTGSFDFDLSQINQTAVTSTTQNLGMNVFANETGSTMTGDMSVMNNTVTANAWANNMYNNIAYGGGSTSGNRLISTQINSGTVTARIQSVNMGITVAGITGTNSNVGVRNNTITASAVANSATNIIRLR